MSRHHHHDPPPPAACCSCCGCGCGCSAPAPPCGYYPAPPQPDSGSDHLLHAIAAHLLLNSGAPPTSPQPQQHHQPQPQPQAPPPAPHHANLYSYAAYQSQYQQAPAPPPHQQQQQQLNPPGPDHGQLLLHSLLRRVAALETTLPGCFPSPPPPLHPNHHHPRPQHRASAAHQEEAPLSPPPPRRRRAPSETELAARTIQEHFRRFLARRSRTLRQLKELAMLRSKAASLRGSLSGRRRCADPAAVSESVMRLLFHLDGIQGEDPMIREGKHAVSRELCRIIEFVDKVLLKDHQQDNEEYPEGCHGASAMNRATVNKKVSFHCNGAEKEADESCESSSSAEADERKSKNSKKTANGKPGLAAPVPVHMEDF